jgi:hypothetical protein
MRRLSALLLPLALLAACSAPPQKELDMAQGALDAARAAGAEQYAVQEYSAASSALQQAHDAVSQRDYRLALTRALDAHDRAQDAAKAAADGKARARGETEAAIAAASAAITQIRTRIAAAEAARMTRKDVAQSVNAADAADGAVQKARAAIKSQDYRGAREMVKEIPRQISAELIALDALAAKRTAKPARRGR